MLFANVMFLAVQLQFEGSRVGENSDLASHSIFMWVFPKKDGTPKSSILLGFSIIFTIHFGGQIPLFVVQHPCQPTTCKTGPLFQAFDSKVSWTCQPVTGYGIQFYPTKVPADQDWPGIQEAGPQILTKRLKAKC